MKATPDETKAAVTRLNNVFELLAMGGLPKAPRNRAQRRGAKRRRPRNRPQDPRNEHWLRRERDNTGSLL